MKKKDEWKDINVAFSDLKEEYIIIKPVYKTSHCDINNVDKHIGKCIENMKFDCRDSSGDAIINVKIVHSRGGSLSNKWKTVVTVYGDLVRFKNKSEKYAEEQ